MADLAHVNDLAYEGDRVIKRYVTTRPDAAEREWRALTLLAEHVPGLAPEPPACEEGVTPVFGAGDGNLANFLWDGTRVRIVDFEDSGHSDLAYEVAEPQPARHLRAAGRTGPGKIGRMRLAGAGDREVVERLVHDAYAPWIEVIGMRPLPMEADYAALIAAGRVHVTDELDGLIVLVPEDGVLLVENVAVRPEARGKGLGRGLMAYAEEEARRLGLAALRLYTNVKMASNIALYESLGYVETGREGVEGRSAVLMRKQLSP
ncbi:Phosphotransferase enzyme family protein [Nonomuraea solani]|uniref:Bifunctional AAC/APH n=1 Tax=Nonomuraea solani TaxID=1144553 RepID=A0A1H6ERD1_9ACTN|nr:GNAT family N-acetyltransferase [Nonomuraea solani]SEG99641.1 Phosphotransferase enzyme family protein [Nonomuraea solani]